MANINLSRDIQILLINKDMKKMDLAEKCGWKHNTFSAKLSRNNFNVTELQKIAEALNCDLEIKFIPRPEPEQTKEE